MYYVHVYIVLIKQRPTLTHNRVHSHAVITVVDILHMYIVYIHVDYVHVCVHDVERALSANKA